MRNDYIPETFHHDGKPESVKGGEIWNSSELLFYNEQKWTMTPIPPIPVLNSFLSKDTVKVFQPLLFHPVLGSDDFWTIRRGELMISKLRPVFCRIDAGLFKVDEGEIKAWRKKRLRFLRKELNESFCLFVIKRLS